MLKNLLLTSVFFFICTVLTAQEKITISGKVTDSLQQPMIGASVYLQGTTIGTATDENGEFVLSNVPQGKQQLSVSYAGYKKFRKEIDASSNITGLSLVLQESSGELGEIVITGTGTPHHLKTAPVPTELISKSLIENTPATDFTSLVESISPSFDFSQNAMGSFIQLNGLGNDFIVILIDGKRVYGDMGGLNDLGRIEPSNIERIEVVKGASSSLYGSDAIAGVINIITKKSKRKFSATNTTQYSSYNTLQQSSNINFNTKNLSGRTSFSQKQSDGWKNSPYEFDKNDSLVETSGMTQNKYVNRNIRQDIELRVTNKLSIYGGGSYYVNDYIYPVSFKAYGLYFEDISYNAGARYILPDHSRIIFDYESDNYKYYYKYNQEYKEYKEGDFSLNTNQLRENYNLKWIGKIGSHQTVTLGGEIVDEMYASEGRLETDDVSVNTNAVYLQDEIKLFNDLLITAGVRAVKHDNFGTIATPKLSVLYKLKGFNFRGTFSQGFKAPTLKEQYYYYEKRGSLYLGNTELDPQTSNYYSLGIDYHNKWLSSSLSVYQNDVNNLIEYQSADSVAGDAANGIKKRRKFNNINEARTRGADISVNVKLPHGFSIGGGYSYVDAQNLTDSIRLEYVAQNYANVRAAYNHKWKDYSLGVQLLGRIQDGKFYDDGSAKGYNIWKLSSSHRFAQTRGTSTVLTVGVDNIFDYIDDVPYGEHRGTISPGRTFFVSLALELAQ